ncbi:MAG: zinc metallopeptidase, partial [Clostridia bacterium]|nr:zinc metallopeptidase [Clostridia bacterium]
MYYYYFLGALLICIIISSWASNKVHKTYAAFREIKTSSHMTGYDTAVTLLKRNGVTDISVGRVKGTLSDHYHPTKKIVNLSESTYGDDSVASVAVAAHEIGHVMQKKKGYFFYNLRTVLVPITNIGSRLALPRVIIGLILDFAVGLSESTDVGYYLALAGVILYGTSFLFTLVTLPVELNASKRAK